MRIIRLFTTLLRQNVSKLRQQVLLLAGLSFLCAFIAFQAGSAAENLLTKGVDFQGLTIAVTAPEGDTTGDTIAFWIGKMQDIKSYCTFLSMGEAEAEEALRQGEISAVLALPPNFVHGILTGTNPDVTLTVSAERPLEALMANWLGGSAADLLTTFQQGIYAVIDVYDRTAPAGIDRSAVVSGINLRYVNWTLGRERCFYTTTASATGSLPLGLHYVLSLAAYFLLALVSVLSAIYARDSLRSQKRLQCIGVGAGSCFAAAVAAGAVVFVPIAAVVLLATKLPVAVVLPAAVIWAVLASLWGSLLCLLWQDDASRGMFSFLLALIFLFLAGGILPPTMLPSAMKTLGDYTLVSAMRNMAAGEYAVSLPVLLGYFAVLSVAGLLLYRKRMQEAMKE